jgi:hypothetical protein
LDLLVLCIKRSQSCYISQDLSGIFTGSASIESTGLSGRSFISRMSYMSIILLPFIPNPVTLPQIRFQLARLLGVDALGYVY